MNESVLKISDFETPYTNIPEMGNSFVRLKKTVYEGGYYRMEGVKGYDRFQCRKPITVTQLQVKNDKWQTLMIDDPMHWLGMQELAELAKPSKVLVAGLGMGLILHHLVKQDKTDLIDVVEIDHQIINFITPYLPKDKRIRITPRNFFGYLLDCQEEYDSVIIDLWVISEDLPKSHRQWVKDSMITAYTLATDRYPNAQVLVWGIRGYKPILRKEVSG